MSVDGPVFARQDVVRHNTHNLIYQLVSSGTNSWPFPKGADYPKYMVSILVGRVV